MSKLKELLLSLDQETLPTTLDLEWALRHKDSWQKWFLGFFDQAVVSHDSAAFFLAEDEGAVVGFCYVVVPKLRLLVGSVGIAVFRDYRRRKVGSALLGESVKWAASAKLRVLTADVWSFNEASLAFFNANGFFEEKRWLEDFKGVKKEKVRLIKLLSHPS